MSDLDWLRCIKDVSDANNADIYLISGGMNSPADKNLISIIKGNKKLENAMLILSTFGGDADVAYRIARCFQREYEKGKFSILIFDICKSAGTLLSLGADELIMSYEAQLGPLDVQINKPDELGEVISGLTPVQALSFLQQHSFKLFEYQMLELVNRSGSQITTKMASEIATKLTIGLFQPIYSHFEPFMLGEYHRNMMVAIEYGERLIECKGNIKNSDVLEKLTHGYPSHGFVIDFKEAEKLFKQIRSPNDIENKALEFLRPIMLKWLSNKDERGHYVAVVNYVNTNLPPEPSAQADVTEQKGVEIPNEQHIQPVKSAIANVLPANKSPANRSDNKNPNRPPSARDKQG